MFAGSTNHTSLTAQSSRVIITLCRPGVTPKCSPPKSLVSTKRSCTRRTSVWKRSKSWSLRAMAAMDDHSGKVVRLLHHSRDFTSWQRYAPTQIPAEKPTLSEQSPMRKVCPPSSCNGIGASPDARNGSRARSDLDRIIGQVDVAGWHWRINEIRKPPQCGDTRDQYRGRSGSGNHQNGSRPFHVVLLSRNDDELKTCVHGNPYEYNYIYISAPKWSIRESVRALFGDSRSTPGEAVRPHPVPRKPSPRPWCDQGTFGPLSPRKLGRRRHIIVNGVSQRFWCHGRPV